MKAMKQVVLNAPDLKASYMSNAGGYDTEDTCEDKHYPPVPFYKTADGRRIVRWNLTLRERWRYLLQKREKPPVHLNGVVTERYSLLRGISDRLFIDPKPGEKVLPFVMMPPWSFVKFLMRGDLWQEFVPTPPDKQIFGGIFPGGPGYGELGGIHPGHITASCPVNAKEERSHGSRLFVCMAAKGQVPDGGTAFIAKIDKTSEGFTSNDGFSAHPTENEAIASVGFHLKAINNGKWNSAKDAMSYSGGEPYRELCPECGGVLVRTNFNMQDELRCQKCKKTFNVPGWMNRAVYGANSHE